MTRTGTPALSNTVLVDTREKPGHCWFEQALADGSARRATLPTADYTVEGLEHVVLVERKSLGDLVACCGYARARFERELKRLADETRLPVLCIEAVVAEVELHHYRGRIAPAAILGSLCAWQLDYRVRVHFGGSPASCEAWARRLFAAIERRVERGALGAVP